LEEPVPPYNATPGNNTPVTELLPNVLGYAFGSHDNTRPTRRGTVNSVAIASNVATIGVVLLEGYIPKIGDLITVVNTASDGGAANVVNVALTAVNISTTTGAGTLSYAATGTNQTTTPDSGMFYIPVPEVGETLANGSSQAFAVPEAGSGHDDNGLTITWRTYYPSAPGAVTMALQASEVDQDSQYSTLDTSTNTGGETRVITLTRFRFLRVNASGVSGGTFPTVVATIAI
jgi:hypothetical protein